MADATVYNLTQKIWTKVTTSSTLATIYNRDPDFKYYQTTRATGGSAPAAVVGNTVPEEAVQMFRKKDVEVIPSSDGIDIYVVCFSSDSGESGTGKIRVDY